MAVNKQDRQALEQKVHLLRGDGGLVALWELLKMDEQELNRRWPDTTGEALQQMQGQARTVRKLLRVIEQGSVIKMEAGQ